MNIGAPKCYCCHKVLKENDHFEKNICKKCYNKLNKPLLDFKFYPVWEHKFEIDIGSYFDNRLRLNTTVTQLICLLFFVPSIFLFGIYSLFLVPFLFFGYGHIFWYLPVYTKYDECEPPRYGYYYFENSLWITRGKKIKCIHMPWERDWIRTSMLVKQQSSLMKNGTTKYSEDAWIHETKGNRLEFYREMWKSVLWTETYPYTYTLKNGKVQNVLATVQVEEREWRPRWFKWTSLFKSTYKTINVNFSAEVGEETGSWKGGTVGCGYEMLPNETPEDTLRRMEKERKL
ncbi:MAG: hypothetical protein WC554_12220 [Clostridia bacterium]